MIEKSFQCVNCQHEWSVVYGTGKPNTCPQCNGTNLHRSKKERSKGRWGGAGLGMGKGRCGRQMS